MIEETDTAGGLIRVNNYGHDLIRTFYLDEGYHRYYHYDGLGSVRALSDVNGDLTDEYEYDAFGILLNSTGDTPNQYLYTGEQWDADLGMYFLRARYNNVQTGRFHNMDTYEGRNGEPLTLHKYLYTHGNPVNNIDPSGNISLAEFSVSMSTQLVLARATIGAAFGLTDGLINGQSGWGLFSNIAFNAIGGAFGLPAAKAALVRGGIAKFGLYSIGAIGSLAEGGNIVNNFRDGEIGRGIWNSANLAGLLSLKRILSFKNAFKSMATTLKNSPSALGNFIGMSGVIDPRTGLIDFAFTSRLNNIAQPPVLPNFAPANGTHRDIANQSIFSFFGIGGSDRGSLLGFSLIPDGSGGLSINWRSGQLNPSGEVPEDIRP